MLERSNLINKLAYSLIALATVFFGARALACSCMEPLPIETDFQRYQKVAIGEVSAKSRIDNDDDYGATYLYTIKVTKAYKGIDQEFITVQAMEDDGGNCGVTMEIGEAYLFWIDYREGSRFTEIDWISACDRTTSADHAQADIAWLEEHAGGTRGLMTPKAAPRAALTLF